jgi:hypothetical protein
VRYKLSDIKQQNDELIIDTSKDPEVFVYVNPLKGNHAKLRDENKIAVFRDEEVGRAYELISKALRNCVGYYVVWSEMLSIASQETGGRYEFYRDCL